VTKIKDCPENIKTLKLAAKTGLTSDSHSAVSIHSHPDSTMDHAPNRSTSIPTIDLIEE
jgi:hypothetical protein